MGVHNQYKLPVIRTFIPVRVIGILVIPLLGMLLMNSSVMGTTSARFRSVHSMWIRTGLNPN